VLPTIELGFLLSGLLQQISVAGNSSIDLSLSILYEKECLIAVKKPPKLL